MPPPPNRGILAASPIPSAAAYVPSDSPNRGIPSTSPIPVLSIYLGSPVTGSGPATPSPVQNDSPKSGSADRTNDLSPPQTATKPPAFNIDVSDGKLPPVSSGSTQILQTSRENGVLSIPVSGPGTVCKPLLFRVPQFPPPKVFLSLRAKSTRDAEFYEDTAVSIRGTNSSGAQVCIDFLRNWPVGYSQRIMDVQWLASAQSDRSGSVVFDRVRPTYMERICKPVSIAGEESANALAGILHMVEWQGPFHDDHSIKSWVEASHEGSFLICITDIDPASSTSRTEGSLQVSWMLTSASGRSVAARPSGSEPACVEVDLPEASKRVIVVSPGYGLARDKAISRNGAAVAWIERQETNLFVACVRRLDNSIPGDEDLDLLWDASKPVDSNAIVHS